MARSRACHEDVCPPRGQRSRLTNSFRAFTNGFIVTRTEENPEPAAFESSLRLGGARALVLACCAVLAACAAAPGMNLDAADVRARADVHSIDLRTVQQLQAERRSRGVEAVAGPASFKAEANGYEYRVAPQDVLRVTVWEHPQLTNPSGADQTSGLVVNADGSFFFPYVGSFKAAGRTVPEIREHIARGLLKIIKTPQVDVTVLQYRGQRIHVSGEVRTPGTVAVTDVPPDLTEVIARAGGTTPEADLAGVTVTRGKESARLDLVALYYNGDLRANIRLQHGDVVNVPERRQSRVFVTGEVIRPTPVPMPRGQLTLADALAEAGGLNPLSASAGQIFVIRAGPAARPQIYHLNASAPDALLLADQFVLNSRDVVYVDVAKVVRWARVINNIVPSANFLRESLNDWTPGLPR